MSKLDLNQEVKNLFGKTAVNVIEEEYEIDGNRIIPLDKGDIDDTTPQSKTAVHKRYTDLTLGSAIIVLSMYEDDKSGYYQPVYLTPEQVKLRYSILLKTRKKDTLDHVDSAEYTDEEIAELERTAPMKWSASIAGQIINMINQK